MCCATRDTSANVRDMNIPKAAAAATPPVHPGVSVRESFQRDGISVSEAARQLGVGRPALSAFLNGRASLSDNMASRLERVFGADRDELLNLQTAYDRHRHSGHDRAVAVSPYAPKIFPIKAIDIADWGNHHESRTRLPVLVRTLVHSTVSDPSHLQRVDFPGYDCGEQPGPDGIVEALSSTPWIPLGKSIWELSTAKGPRPKADKDYEARLQSLPAAERKHLHFVVLTVRIWPGRKDWAARMESAGDFKSVRAYDASDLEQWVEQSAPGQIWLAGQLNLPEIGEDYDTLARRWDWWANSTEPPLSRTLFDPWIKDGHEKFVAWFDSGTSAPFVIAADSRDEAHAYLSCLFKSDELRRLEAETVILNSERAAQQLRMCPAPLILVPASVAVGQALGGPRGHARHIIWRSPNSVDTQPHVRLGRLGYYDFLMGLAAMAVEERLIDQLARESGRSLAILRRRLSPNPDIQRPVWVDKVPDPQAAPAFALAGAWNAESKRDQKTLSDLAGLDWSKLQTNFTRLLNVEDPPVWSVRDYQGVTSRLDSLFATLHSITRPTINRFFAIAESVLSESDPALHLTGKHRPAAILHDHPRDHSHALRKGVAETFTLLAAHGDRLFESRLGISVAPRIARAVRTVLAADQHVRLLSLGSLLRFLAESAPDAFLKILEEDLQGDAPVVCRLLVPSNGDDLFFFQAPPHIPLLEALECLAWDTRYVSRVCQILAQLGGHEVDTRWSPTPVESLLAILSAWLPQTTATLDQRLAILRLLMQKYRPVGWRICIDQVNPVCRVARETTKPLWSDTRTDAGGQVSRQDEQCFVSEAVRLLIESFQGDGRELGTLVEHLALMPKDQWARVWDLIDQWSPTADDSAKVELRDLIRTAALTQGGCLRSLPSQTIDRARQAHAALRPSESFLRHGWLYQDLWTKAPAVGGDDNDLRPEENDQRLDELRTRAAREIFNPLPQVDISKILKNYRAPELLGEYAAACLTDPQEQERLVQKCLSVGGDLRPNATDLLSGFLRRIPGNSLCPLLESAAADLPENDAARLFACAPFSRSTLRLVDAQGQDVRSEYWRVVNPDQIPASSTAPPPDPPLVVERLLEAGQPQAAFRYAHRTRWALDTPLFKRLLRDVARAERGPHRPNDSACDAISEALSALNDRNGVSVDEMADLEFHLSQYLIDIDLDGGHGMPNIESRVAGRPAAFVKLVALWQERIDHGIDPQEGKMADPESDRRPAVAVAARETLDCLETIPGTDKDGVICPDRLLSWISEARRLFGKQDIQQVGDWFLGRFLATSPPSSTGTWPCEEVCKVIEEVPSQDMVDGLVGRRRDRRRSNHDRAARYERWAEKRRPKYSRVGDLLDEIAEAIREFDKFRISQAQLDNSLNP